MPARKPATNKDTLTRADIERLIDVIHEKGIEELELEQGDLRVRIVASRRQPAAAPPAPAPAAPAVERSPDTVAATSVSPRATPDEDTNLRKVTSPMVGTFYRSSTPGSKSFAEVGDHVDDKTVLCIIEAMKLMNEIHAETRGIIRKVLVQNGQPVEYGQVLFLVEPS